MAVATRTVEEVLREGGLTRFHRRLVAITGFAWTFVAFEIILISLVLPVMGDEFGIFDLATFTATDPFLYGMIVSATLLGSFVGGLVFGRMARRGGASHALPGLRRPLRGVHGADGRLVRHRQPVRDALPSGAGPWRDARDRPRDPVRVPAAAASGTIHGLPRLLLARRVPARDRVLVSLLHRARWRVATALPRGGVPRFHRVPIPYRGSGESVIPGP